jgi:hypothetical protein
MLAKIESILFGDKRGSKSLLNKLREVVYGQLMVLVSDINLNIKIMFGHMTLFQIKPMMVGNLKY